MDKNGQKTGGRKRGTTNKSKQEVRDIIDRAVKKRGGMKFIINKLLELVEGVQVEKEYKNKEKVIYLERPDGFAAKTLLEYRFGKPMQAVELNSGDNPIQVEIYLPQKEPLA